MKRIGILVVAFNAESTLAHVLDRIPRDFVPEVERVLVADDASHDSTYLVGVGYQQTATELPLTVVRHARNLGYGGNQKAGYRWAIEHDLDIVVLLHGDGQYAPELLPAMVEPLVLEKADAVFGSRMMERGEARRGGMPLYKFVGNRILTTVENSLAGMELSEWHSGYRAYSVEALASIPFERNSDGFDFDTQIILQLHEAGKRIEEIPIPTYYGDEICYVNGLQYAGDVTRWVLRYRAQKMGFGGSDLAFASTPYEAKREPETSHVRLLGWLGSAPRSRVLDLGCADGSFAAEMRVHGHRVTGVDLDEEPGIHDRVDAFVAADLDDGIPDEVGNEFDVVVAADVLEHVKEPLRLLSDASAKLRPGGSILASIPNFGHWYVRGRVLAGAFDYDRRGILDRGHLRFFTRRSFERLVTAAGLRVRRREVVGLPLEVLDRGGAGSGHSALGRLARRIDRFFVAVWPTLFGYQFLYELEANPES
ncbi:MAG: bifunctional glycosyltransferase/class I SAM-dependent methyltransferase [Acidimicrobiia bacterium]